jgi:hypothetical protein
MIVYESMFSPDERQRAVCAAGQCRFAHHRHRCSGPSTSPLSASLVLLGGRIDGGGGIAGSCSACSPMSAAWDRVANITFGQGDASAAEFPAFFEVQPVVDDLNSLST